MNFQFYLEKLFDSEEFQKFKKENPDAFLCSCFFSRDFENLKNPDDKTHFDYFVPSVKKMFSFQLEKGNSLVPIDIRSDEKITKLRDNSDFELDEVKKIISARMEQENVKSDIRKMLLSLQNLDGKDYLLGTIFISGLGMIKVKIDLENKKIIDFEKKSFFDIVNVFKK